MSFRRNKTKTNIFIMVILYLAMMTTVIGCNKKEDGLSLVETHEFTNDSGADSLNSTNLTEEEKVISESETETNKAVSENRAVEADAAYEQSESSIKSTDKDYSRYLGYWSNEIETCTATIHSINNESIHFSFYSVNENQTKVAEVEEVVGTIQENEVKFEFTDSWMNKGNGTLILNDNSIDVKTSITSSAPQALYDAAVDTVLVRTNGDDTGQEAQDNTFIFLDSNTRYLSEDEILLLSKEKMEIARNEIYARHERLFKDSNLATYFSNQKWYHGTVDSEDFDNNQELIFNEFEKFNINLIQKIEDNQ